MGHPRETGSEMFFRPGKRSFQLNRPRPLPGAQAHCGTTRGARTSLPHHGCAHQPKGLPLPTKGYYHAESCPPRRSDPAHPPSLPAQPRKHRRAHRRTGALLFAGAVASFGLALVLIGAAVSFAAGAPAPANLDQSTLVFGSLAAACALAALGMMLALRERSLRTQQMLPRHPCRADPGRAGQSGPHAQGDAHCQAHPAASKLCDHRRRAAPGRAHGAIPCHEYLPEGLCQQSARFRACHPGRRAQRRPERRRPVATLPAAAATKRHRPTAEAPRAPDAPSAAKIPACPGAAPTTRRRASPRKTLAASKSAEIPTVPLAAPRPSAAGRPCATAGRREDGHSQRRSLARPHIW